MLKIKTYRRLNYAFNKKDYEYATLLEQFLLIFVKPKYYEDKGKYYKTTLITKKLKNKIFIVDEIIEKVGDE